MVSVADDGGSSGRLRRQLDIMPPGDLRKCLVALAEEGSALADAFEQRFEAEELVGHALGNLVIAGLMGALRRPPEGPRRGGPAARGGRAGWCPPPPSRSCSRPSPRRGRSRARPRSWRTAPHPPGVARARPTRPASPVALHALGQADQVVIGPGSLFTSVLAAVAVPGLAEAIRRSPGAPGLRGQPAPRGTGDGRASTWPTTWPPWPPTGSRSTSWWPTRPPSPSGDLGRRGGGGALWPRPTGGPTTRRDWRPPSAVWSDRA